MRPILTMLNEAFKKIVPEEHQAIDEQMIAFKGHSILCQYMPAKLIRYGIKVWARAGASGFVYAFDVYQGKGTVKDDEANVGMGSRVVLDLLAGLEPHVGHKVFVDRFFTSLNLAIELKKRRKEGYLFCGTVNKNHLRNPPLVPEKEFRKMDCGMSTEVVEEKNNVVITQWLDNKEVVMISNYVGKEPISERHRYDRLTKKYIVIERLAVIQEYNKFMGGVDLNDMLRTMYAFSFKCQRWYVFIFTYLSNLTSRNAWLYYRRCLTAAGEKPIHLQKFLQHSTIDLVKESARPDPPKRPIVASSSSSTDGQRKHMPIFQEQIGECVLCTKKKNRHQLYIMCTECQKILRIA